MKTLMNFKLVSVTMVFFLILFLACQKDVEVVKSETTDSTTVIDSQTSTSVEKANYYVSLSGNDANAGTLEKPFKTIEKAFSVCKNTDLVYVRGGTYPLKDNTRTYGLKFAVTAGKDSAHKIRIWAYPGERVVLDCKSMSVKNDGLVGIYIESNNIHLKGFDVINVPQYINPENGHGNYNVGILIKGACVTLEDCSAHDCQGTGINLGGSCWGTLVLNCDAYNNYDPYTYFSDGTAYPGGNADGFHITVSGLNMNQVLRGCRSWNNSDDGYDCYNTDGYVNFDSCWAFQNGYLPNSKTASKGDGSGIKLGATSGQYDILKKNVISCISAANRAEGFTQNNGRVVMHIYNNTAYKNGGTQFDFGNKFVGQANVELKNNLAVGSTSNYIPYAKQDHNSWNLSVVANDADFQSVDVSLLKATRQKGGKLPNNAAFRLASGSDLKGKGVNVGRGTNLGAY
jgi:hypothetical protein